MVNKQDFQNYKAELQITIGNKITEAINKLNEGITVKLENNKDEIIQSLNNEVSSLQNRVGRLESQVHLLEDALINNEIKIKSADQYSRRNNIVIQSIPQSINPFSTGILWKLGITKKAKHPTLNASIS